MACFSADATKILTDNGKAELHTALEKHHADILGRRVDYIEYGKKEISNKRRAQLNCDLLKQVLIHRAAQLMSAAGAMLAQKNLHGLSLAVRGHVETLAVLGYFTRRLDSLQKGHITFEVFEQDIANGLLGAKHDLFDKANAPVNILTCVQHTDKYADAELFKEKKEMVEDQYGWLSEFAHPNFCSNKTSFSLDKETGRMMLRKEEEISEDHFQILRSLQLSADLISWFLIRFDENKKAALPD
jgi:hypothetical protein